MELLDQIKVRFPFEREELKHMSILNPDNVFNKKHPSVIPLAISFSNVISQNDYNAIDSEWRLLMNSELENVDSKTSYEDFWNSVRSIKNGLGQPMFPLLLKLADHIDILPHSSATVERVFSAVNLNKTSQELIFN